MNPAILSPAMLLFSSAADSPFIVPVAGCFMILGIVAASMWAGTRKREIESQERLAAIARGVPLPPTPEEFAVMHGKPSGDTVRTRNNTRRGGIVVTFSAVGLIVFFHPDDAHHRPAPDPCRSRRRLIPLGVGIGLLLDARHQTRELEEAAAKGPANSGLVP